MNLPELPEGYRWYVRDARLGNEWAIYIELRSGSRLFYGAHGHRYVLVNNCDCRMYEHSKKHTAVAECITWRAERILANAKLNPPINPRHEEAREILRGLK